MSDRITPKMRDALEAIQTKRAALEHGMVLVRNDTLLVPTCLCGWIGAGERNATAFGKARSSWKGHVELEVRLADADAGLVKVEMGNHE